jgi:hypothetical protein
MIYAKAINLDQDMQSIPTNGKLAANIMHFARVLREAGLPVGPAAVMDALDAAQSGALLKREDFYWALHAVFVKRREQHEIFDQAFHIFWKRPKILDKLLQMFLVQVPSRPDEPPQAKAGSRRLAEALFEPPETEPRNTKEENLAEFDAAMTASAQEILKHKDFEQMSAAEAAAARKALARFRFAQVPRRTRRYRPDAAGARIDLRRMLRESLRAGGEFTGLPRRSPQTRLPPLVVLCDISGSCEAYSRMFLHFLHALANDRSRMHIFLFGTRLSNVTRDLQRRDVDEALARVTAHVQDWSGGTRIGATLHEFNFKWARRVLGQGAEVLLMTDGLEREGTEQLARGMARLKGFTRRITWLNPLLRYEAFAPVAAGVRAIMPHVSAFRPVHNLESLAALAQGLAAPPSRQHDPARWMERMHEHA